MRRQTVAMGLTLLLGTALGTPAWAAADRTVQVGLGAPATWTTPATTGFNVNYGENVPDSQAAPAGICSRDIRTYCEVVLVQINNPLTEQEIEDGKTTRTAQGTFRVSWTRTSVPNDFDIFLFESDANGTQGAEIDTATNDYNSVVQTTTATVTTTIEQPTVYLLAHVIYWSVIETAYNGSATLTGSVTT